jgi:hypothetical protein
MAKGGGKRTYARDGNGRFASGGGKSAALKGGTLAARSSLKRSKAKDVSGASRQQAGAVTRAKTKLSSAIASSKRKGPAMSGVLRGGIARRAKADANKEFNKSYESARAKGKSPTEAYSATSKSRGKKLAKQFLASGKKASAKKAAKPAAKPMEPMAKKAAPAKAAPAKAAPKRTPKGSGGTSVAAGRKAKEKWQMKRANQRFKKTSLPADYSPKQTRKIRRVAF